MTLVVPDELVDRTTGRVQSSRRRGSRPRALRGSLLPDVVPGPLAGQDGVSLGGTMVVVEGPRFSTRAESQHFAAQVGGA